MADLADRLDDFVMALPWYSSTVNLVGVYVNRDRVNRITASVVMDR